ncbi:DMT family transporter [Ilumatobacter sp.]|uniref:DMT family transporter n=1 Tax=Ilumatobacter sp. TaxID=1967498 RepID=UPI003AF50250
MSTTTTDLSTTDLSTTDLSATTTGDVSPQLAATSLERIRAWDPSPRTATVAIVAASVAMASAAFFARRLTGSGVSPVAVAFFRYASAAIVLAPFLRLTGPKRIATWWGLASGAAAGLGWIAYVESIRRGDLATTGVAYMTYPVFTLVACTIVFRRAASVRSIVAAALVVVAAALAFGPNPGTIGSPLLFIAPATFGLGVAILTERLGSLDPFERLSAVAFGASAALAPLIVTMPAERVVPAGPGGWSWVIGIGIGCALVPMLVYAAAAPAVGAARSAVAGGVELPTIFVIGAVFFGESVRAEHLAAAAIIVTAIALTPSARSIHVLPEADESPAPTSSPTRRSRPTWIATALRRPRRVRQEQPATVRSPPTEVRGAGALPTPR